MDIQSSSIFWLVCCFNFKKLCVILLCVICMRPCCFNACIMMVFSVTAAATRSLAVCQPSKACYVIKDFCALYQVLVIALCWGGLNMAQLIACLHGGTHSDWSSNPVRFVLSEHCSYYLSLFFLMCVMYGDVRRDIRAWAALLTSFHPSSRGFSPSGGRPRPSATTPGKGAFVLLLAVTGERLDKETWLRAWRKVKHYSSTRTHKTGGTGYKKKNKTKENKQTCAVCGTTLDSVFHICSTCSFNPWYFSVFLCSVSLMFLSAGIASSITAAFFC